ncbi:hypothetical protein KR038_012143 [Drosophila bunnanda]|nr:hypothetical protein KR038_012143 [Drosophila bunnanda]
MVEYTNIKCKTVDSEFCDFETCRIKSVNRTYKYFSVKVRLFKVPITKAKVNIALYKRLNGLKPFLYNVTIDGCKFLQSTTSYPVAKYFYDFSKDFSNINHTCPYNHDLIVDKVPASDMNHRLTRVLPFPEGSYVFQSHWYVYNIKRAEVGLYLTLS